MDEAERMNQAARDVLHQVLPLGGAEPDSLSWRQALAVVLAALRAERAAGRAEAADEITQLRALIDAYAEHDGSCAVYRDGDECSCGYRAAKRALDRA